MRDRQGRRAAHEDERAHPAGNVPSREPSQAAPGVLADQLQGSPRQLALQRQTSTLFGPVQRKVIVDGAPYSAKPSSSPAVQEAASDEFVRHYNSEQELTDHIDAKVPGTVGLIKQRALWYRIPMLGQQFFVFGESHAAVRGSSIKEASNIQAPILDEALPGWSVGQTLAGGGGDVGVDENASKLMRALEIWNPDAFANKVVNPSPETVPKIPRGESSTRDTEQGTYRLVVPGEDGNESWWKPSGQQQVPPSTHDLEGEVLSAVSGLFGQVFATEIAQGTLDSVAPKTSTAWTYFQNKTWKNHPQSMNIQWNVRSFMLAAAKAKVSGEYAKLRLTKGGETQDEDKNSWRADNYRDEFMFVRILEAAGKGTYAFANIGDLHLQALKGRLLAHNVPVITMADFFNRYSQTAVDTQAIAYKNSPEFRTHQRLSLWMSAALRTYPNLQQWHLDTLSPADYGEFVLYGKVSKLESQDSEASDGDQHEAVFQQFFRDIKKAYPNSDDFLSSMTLEQIGEFLLDGKIEEWELMS